MAKIKRFRVAPELLAQTLKLPEGSKIVNIYDSPSDLDSWEIVVECDDFEDVAGLEIPEVEPVVSRIYEDRVISDHIEWDWGE